MFTWQSHKEVLSYVSVFTEGTSVQGVVRSGQKVIRRHGNAAEQPNRSPQKARPEICLLSWEQPSVVSECPSPKLSNDTLDSRDSSTDSYWPAITFCFVSTSMSHGGRGQNKLKPPGALGMPLS